MRLASALLVCTLLSTCMISGTFAKYTSQDSGSDVARVAKWGVELQVAGDLYGSKYKASTENIATAEDTGITVKGLNALDEAENVVAPGTKSSEAGFSFKLNGKPEVKTAVTTKIIAQNIFLNKGEYGIMVSTIKDGKNLVTEANFADLNSSAQDATADEKLYEFNNGKYTVANSYVAEKEYFTLEDVVLESDFEADKYYPVVYKLNGDTYTSDAEVSNDADSLAVVSNKVLTKANADTNTAIAEVNGKSTLFEGEVSNKEYDVNYDFTKELGLKDTYITWDWAFSDANTEEQVGDLATGDDKADTILGQMIAESKDTTLCNVVKKASEGTYSAVTYVPVEPDKNAGDKFEAYTYVTDGTNTIACLTTQFSIDITVTQVD